MFRVENNHNLFSCCHNDYLEFPKSRELTRPFSKRKRNEMVSEKTNHVSGVRCIEKFLFIDDFI